MFPQIFGAAPRPEAGLEEGTVAAPEDSATTDEEILDRIAAQIVRRGMVTPAVFFIELNRPLTFLAGQATHVLFPFLAPLLGAGLARRLAELLEDPANVDRLLAKLEQRALSERPGQT